MGGEFSIEHILVVLVVVLIFFGPQKLGDLGGNLGKGIRNFKKGISGQADPPPRKKKKKRRPPPELEDQSAPVAELEGQSAPVAELEEQHAPSHQDA